MKLGVQNFWLQILYKPRSSKNGVIVTPTGRDCQCPAGYSGDACEITPCSSQPCQNDGTCSPDGSAYTCSCQSGYFGSHCQTSACTPDPCENYGVCVVLSEVGHGCKSNAV